MDGYKLREDVFREFLDTVSWQYKPDLSEMLDFWYDVLSKCAQPVKGLYSVLEYLTDKNKTGACNKRKFSAAERKNRYAENQKIYEYNYHF